MNIYVIISLAVIAIALIVEAILWRKMILKKKHDQEQVDRKAKEKALDLAIANQMHKNSSSHSETPVSVYYSGDRDSHGTSEMIRLTEVTKAITKEYLFTTEDNIFLGEEFNRAAIFQSQGNNKIYCELFFHGDGMYVRCCCLNGSRLIRNKKKASIGRDAIRLESGDVIKTPVGKFLVEFI